MDSKEYLPLGTIVKLRLYTDALEEINHIIIGYECINSTTAKQYKYSLAVYPYGLVTDNIWYANQADIVSLMFIPST